MYPIVRKEKLADQIILMDIKAPLVAKKCLPGQFIIAKTDEIGERIPLTICDYDREAETVTIVVQTIGAGTKRMMDLNVGDELMDFVGPLGCASELCEEKNLEETKQKKAYSGIRYPVFLHGADPVFPAHRGHLYLVLHQPNPPGQRYVFVHQRCFRSGNFRYSRCGGVGTAAGFPGTGGCDHRTEACHMV